MKITIYFGTGGVGKTSVAAATALARARAGAKCLVLTTDPALRLRTAFGLKHGIAEQRVALGSAGRGELWASQLDVRVTLDQAVRQYAVPRDRDRILGHSIYGTIAESLSGMQELMTLERIDQLRRRGFENIVIDTAPSRRAIEVLNKPVLFAEFAGSNWVKLMGRTYKFAEGLGMMAMGRKTLDTYTRVESMLGAKLVREVIDFYSLFVPVAEAFALRAQRTVALLKDPAVTDFRMVSTPHKARRDARFFSKALQDRGLRLSRVMVNRVWDREPVATRLAGTAGEALEWYRCVRAGQASEISLLREEQSDVRTLAELDRDVDGLDALEGLAGQLAGE